MTSLWLWIITIAAGIAIVSGRYASYGVNVKRYPSPDGKGLICGDIDIRNDVKYFSQLENCTVIEGHLQILLIEGATQEQYQQLEFPDLVEITDYFLLFRVYGLKTLSHIFPNLSVIRGQRLFFDFALVAYEMMDLEELGLWGLTSIERGAVRLEKNPLLCYIDTVDWTKIAVGIKESSDHFFKENKDVRECVNMCPRNCTETTLDNRKARRCWTLKHCQRILTCGNNINCASGMCDNGICCDHNCLGGCRGRTKRDCVACKGVINVFNNQTVCAKQCLPGTYEYRKRRCLREEECIQTNNKLVKANHTSDPGVCAQNCPSGYMESQTDNTTCVKCADRCPRGCPSKRVDNVKSAQELKGCTVIEGHLEIRIKKGSNIGQELEENLGEIEEVKGHLWIHSSDALLSLNFFKRLRKIHGQALANQKFALLVNDNVNLQELFTEDVTNNLIISNGSIVFHYNRKLCLHKIMEFVDKVQMQNKSLNDISKTTNGDHMPCKVSTLNLKVVRVSARIAFLRWQNFKVADPRHLFGYIINYKEAPFKNVSIYDGRDACSEDIWSTKDVLNKSDREEEFVSNLIVSLKPWTQYAVYIQTYTTSSAEYGAMSKVVYFRTAPAYPTVPVNLKVDPKMNGSLYVTWNPPTNPHGNVTHYIVYWRPRPLVAEKLYERNYCDEPLFSKEETDKRQKDDKKTVEKENTRPNTTGLSEQCACPKTKEQITEEENERLLQIEFENYLHNFVYIKRLNSKKAKILFKSKASNSSNTDNAGQPRTRKRRDNPPAERYKREAQTQYNTSKSDNVIVEKDNDAMNITGDNDTDRNSTADKEGPYYTVIVENRRNILITNLGHFKDYNIEVIACQERDPRDPQKEKLCSSRAITMARTLPDKSADNIDSNSVVVMELKNRSGEVLVSWDAPPNPNGLIVAYTIKYNKVMKNVQPISYCSPHNAHSVRQSYKLVKLEPGNYSVQIRSISLARKANFTTNKYFTVTDKSEAPVLWAKETIIAVTVSAVFLLILMAVIAVWFVARSRFSKVPDYADHISANPDYMQHGEVYQPDEWEVDRDKIKLIRELGQGSFGMVYEGLSIDLDGDGKEVKVAVKTVNEHASFSERMNFLKEASTMKAFKCNHVVRLLGVVSEGQPAYVIMELMENGDLKNFLRMHRPDEEASKIPRQPLSLKQIIKMAGEIADGMAYLADKKYVHRDLAARNCMVAGDLTVKIGDFGMTRDIYETDYYRKGGKALLPVRWMAPESLKDGIFTSLSDVWSYGVVLWEMATLAAQPYQGLSNEEVLKYVSAGKKMDKPEGCPDRLFSLMYQCWNYRPKQRPTFKEIIEMLVPQLDPSFKERSYFFSDENKDNADVNEDFEDEDEEEYPDESNVPFISNSEVCGAASGGGSPDTLNFMEDNDVGDEFRSFNPPHPLYVRDDKPSSARHCHNDPRRNHYVNDQWEAFQMDKSKFAAEPCDCVVLEETNTDPNHRYSSNCNSAIGSVIGSSDGSKESSKSSNSSYAQMNGIHLANGHVPLHHMRSTKC
ncbi:hypothetical protein FSP39_023260 [Pinctada imbricata]|uniref:Tyrosine-protein kinase receptor n=1 Tax=Pinctada imbricata TaxID=66713 RepID=A0AA89C2N6_PINIB|nr:hypothetical protein FSP39_023260 [Pinctada imbricata]